MNWQEQEAMLGRQRPGGRRSSWELAIDIFAQKHDEGFCEQYTRTALPFYEQLDTRIAKQEDSLLWRRPRDD